MRSTTLHPTEEQLTEHELRAWRDALATVDAVASGTDTASPQKQPLEALAFLVRTHPAAVVNALAEQT